MRALVTACRGTRLRDRRDETIVRVMIETGARASEAADMRTGDIDLQAGSVVVRRGKGCKGRTSPIGPATTRAVDKYLRLRHTAATRWLEHSGSETGAMTVMGWSRADLLRRYTQANRERLAADEARRLNPGDL